MSNVILQIDFKYQIVQSTMSRFTKMLSDQFISQAINNPTENETCQQMHNGSCNMKSLSQFAEGCKSVYKMYLLVHLIPLLLFKRKKLKQNPLAELKKFLKGFIKSMLFAGGYSMLIRRTVCFVTTHVQFTHWCSVISALTGSVTLILEPMSRQSQIALFTLNKSMEVTYNMARRRKWNVKVPYGECWLNAVAMAIICFTFLNDPDIWRQSYRKGLDKFLGGI